jgi:hypothetical protein
MMPLQNFSVKSFRRQGYGCTKGELWSKNHQRRERNESSPFYLVYRFCKETDLEWLYNLIKIHLVPNDENIAFLFPKENSKAELGYELFKTASLVMPLIKLRKHGSRIKLPKECNRILEQKSN